MGTTPQAANVLVTGMMQERLVERMPHPTLTAGPRNLRLTEEGVQRFKAALPYIRRLEATMSKTLDQTELAIVKRWLVESARALSSERSKGK